MYTLSVNGVHMFRIHPVDIDNAFRDNNLCIRGMETSKNSVYDYHVCELNHAPLLIDGRGVFFTVQDSPDEGLIAFSVFIGLKCVRNFQLYTNSKTGNGWEISGTQFDSLLENADRNLIHALSGIKQRLNTANTFNGYLPVEFKPWKQ
jgi:hypothetical protein